jgi:class 3 adenylate cyclase
MMAGSLRLFAVSVALTGELKTPETRAALTKWLGKPSGHAAIVFTDLVGSTTIEIAIGSERYGEMRRAHFSQARRIISKNKGFAVKTIGDAFLALFHGATEALDFALALHRNSGHKELKVRAGIHVGRIEIEEEDAFGLPVNFAARVVAAAKSDQVFLSADARREIAELKPRRFDKVLWREHLVETKEGSATMWEAH